MIWDLCLKEEKTNLPCKRIPNIFDHIQVDLLFGMYGLEKTEPIAITLSVSILPVAFSVEIELMN